MTRISLDQARAAYAWRVVQGCGKDYVNLAKAAPALIMNNGLMQTLAFYQSKSQGKDKSHHGDLAAHIRGWLRRQDHVQGDDFRAVMDSLTASDAAAFRRTTEEALALLRWIRQFAAAIEHKADPHG